MESLAKLLAILDTWSRFFTYLVDYGRTLTQINYQIHVLMLRVGLPEFVCCASEAFQRSDSFSLLVFQGLAKMFSLSYSNHRVLQTRACGPRQKSEIKALDGKQLSD